MIPFNHKKPDFDKKFYTDQWGKFIKSWKWYNENGEWIFCTVRYENKEGKNIIPFYYDNKWKSGQIINNDRPLMDVHKIINSEKDILLVEGEKCYDVGKENFSENFCITTWCGGTGGITKTNWKVIKERKTYYWYDNDDPGRKTIVFLKNVLNKLILVHPPKEKEKGWDIYDAVKNDNWDIEETLLYMMQFTEYEKKENYIDNIEWPFKILGPGCGYYHFLHGENGEIFKVKQGGLGKSHLEHLASKDFWSENFGYETKRGPAVSWVDAKDLLIRECNLKQPFDHNNIRGRGIWQDKNSLVINTGNNLVFQNNIIDIRNYSPNGYVYEKTYPLNLYIKKSKISDFETIKIFDCIEKLSIYTFLEKIYLLGWCILAPFCGALEWRPHIWITGPAGSGKTAILNYIISPFLGDFGFFAEGGSTGAGIVQNLRNDCFPVVHDEVDKTKQGRENLVLEIEIARSASSTKRSMYKGTADQTGKRYRYNSMFCLLSINVILNQESDKSRFSIITLKKNKNIEWKSFQKEIIETFNINICEKIKSLFFYNWKIAKQSINNFKNTCGIYFGDQRTGDQIGTLLAGYCLLEKFKIYTIEEIQKICEKYLKDFKMDDIVPDEMEMIIKIFTTKIKYINYNEKTEDTTILYLLKRAAGETADNTPDPRASKELFKYGIKLKDKSVFIAYSYEWIKEILKNTPWYNNYGSILKRLDFAKKDTKVVNFGNYYHGRAVELIAECVLRLSDDLIYTEAGF